MVDLGVCRQGHRWVADGRGECGQCVKHREAGRRVRAATKRRVDRLLSLGLGPVDEAVGLAWMLEEEVRRGGALRHPVIWGELMKRAPAVLRCSGCDALCPMPSESTLNQNLVNKAWRWALMDGKWYHDHTKEGSKGRKKWVLAYVEREGRDDAG